MIFSLFDFPIKAAKIRIKKSVELMSIISKFIFFKFSAHLITNTRHHHERSTVQTSDIFHLRCLTGSRMFLCR